MTSAKAAAKPLTTGPKSMADAATAIKPKLILIL